MIRGNVKKVAAASLALAIALSSTAFAAVNQPAGQNENKSISAHFGRHKRGGLLSPDVLSKLGLTRDEVDKARGAKKNFFDLAKEKKGYTTQQVKDIIIKTKTDAINKKAAEGRIPKSMVNMMITKTKERVTAWDGNLDKIEKMKHKHKK